MRIAGFAAENMASSHLRVKQWIAAMKDRGHDAEFHGDSLRDLTTIDRKFEGCDIVVYGRTHDIHRIVALHAGRKVHGFKLIVDTDDLVDNVPRYNFASSAFNNSTGLIRMSHAQYREADAVTCSTPFLRAATEKHNSACYLVPNFVDTSLWKDVRSRQKEARHRDDIRIYWGGGGGHYDDLLVAKDAVLAAYHKYPNVKLIFGNFVPAWAAGLAQNRVFFHPLIPYGLYPKLLTWLCADIGIAPLVAHPFNQAKSHVKWLDYAMAGVPGMYQRIDAYETVTDGYDGVLADSPEEWRNRMDVLIQNAELRRVIARQARNTVLATWTVDNFAANYERMCLKVAGESEPVVAQPLIEGEPIALTVQANV